jgi:phage repressor protein C with HTH and peptisase S24 domain
MAPTLRSGDIVLVNSARRVQKGDLVLVRWPSREGQLSIKRAIHPVGDLWYVLGDNQFGSTDSRTLGPAEVLKVVRWRVWPRPKRLR